MLHGVRWTSAGRQIHFRSKLQPSVNPSLNEFTTLKLLSSASLSALIEPQFLVQPNLPNQSGNLPPHPNSPMNKTIRFGYLILPPEKPKPTTPPPARSAVPKKKGEKGTKVCEIGPQDSAQPSPVDPSIPAGRREYTPLAWFGSRPLR